MFIWGFGQSGTFLLYDVVALSGQFYFPSTRGPRKKGFATAAYADQEVQLREKPVEGILTCWSDVGLPWEGTGGWTYDRFLGAEWVRDVDVARVKRNYAQLKEAWLWQSMPRRPVLDKFPFYLLMAGLLDAVFPTSRHIFALRDPRMILSSVLHRFKEPGYELNWRGYPSGFYGNVFPSIPPTPPISLEDRHVWQIDACLRHGVEMARRLGPRCMPLHYEALCNDTNATLDRLADFLGVPFPEPQRWAIRKGLKPARTHPWPGAMLYIDLGKLHSGELLTSWATALGYAAHTAGSLEKPRSSVKELTVPISGDGQHGPSFV